MEHKYVCENCGLGFSYSDKECEPDLCLKCEEYRVEYNVAIANGLVVEAKKIVREWGSHNRFNHRG